MSRDCVRAHICVRHVRMLLSIFRCVCNVHVPARLYECLDAFPCVCLCVYVCVHDWVLV